MLPRPLHLIRSLLYFHCSISHFLLKFGNDDLGKHGFLLLLLGLVYCFSPFTLELARCLLFVHFCLPVPEHPFHIDIAAGLFVVCFNTGLSNSSTFASVVSVSAGYNAVTLQRNIFDGLIHVSFKQIKEGCILQIRTIAASSAVWRSRPRML